MLDAWWKTFTLLLLARQTIDRREGMRHLIRKFAFSLAALAALAPAAASAEGSYIYSECKFGTCKVYLCTSISYPGPDLTTQGGPDAGGSIPICEEIGSYPDNTEG
jgi:hypothetical protein